MVVITLQPKGMQHPQVTLRNSKLMVGNTEIKRE
jgi:hypothetical protein